MLEYLGCQCREANPQITNAGVDGVLRADCIVILFSRVVMRAPMSSWILCRGSLLSLEGMHGFHRLQRPGPLLLQALLQIDNSGVNPGQGVVDLCAKFRSLPTRLSPARCFDGRFLGELRSSPRAGPIEDRKARSWPRSWHACR